MPFYLRAIIWRYQRRLLEWQTELTKRIIRDSSPNQDAAATLIEGIKDTDRRWLFTAVGQALSTWAAIEDTLIVMATLLLNVDVAKAGLIFYSIFNFNTWLSIVGELFKMDPAYSKLTSSWNKIAHDLRALKNTRDMVAHQTIHHKSPAGDTSLRPGRFDTRIQSKQHQPLHIDQIFTFNDNLAKMILRLSALLDSVTEIRRRSHRG